VSATETTGPVAGQAKPPESAWPFVLIVFAFSRLFFSLAGTLAASLLPWGPQPAGLPAPPGFLNYWAHWDGTWYSAIATEGYGARAPESTAFFPLYPMLVRAGTIIGGGPALWGALVSLAATLFVLYFLYRIAEELLDTRAAQAATLAFAFFPTAFFLNAVYTEALFLALTTGSFWAAYVRRDLLLAGVLGALAAVTRNFGVLLLVPLGYEWLRNRREFGWRGVWQMGLVPTGLLGYVLFLWYRFGDPLIFFSQQSDYWGRDLTDPDSALGMAWTRAGDGLEYVLDPASLFLDPSSTPTIEASNVLNFVFLALFLLLMGVAFVLLPPGLSVYTFLVVLLSVLTPSSTVPLMGLPRYMLGAFPLFFVFAYLFSHSRPMLFLWLLVSSGLGVALTALFVTWRWVA
jgi:mannosyltransferase PIG-V